MPIEILMPALSPTMEEGNLAKWLVNEGDKVAAGDVIAEIETDKATMEVEAVDEGTVAKLVVAEGSEGVKVNALIALLAEDGEDAGAVASYDPSTTVTATSASDGSDNSAVGETEQSDDPQEVAKVETSADNSSSEVETEIPAGTKMNPFTVREALRDAMAEEMRIDEDVFIMGEEVAEYQGAYKITQGLLEEFSPRRVIDTPITEHGFAGIGVGAAMAGLKPIVELIVHQPGTQGVAEAFVEAFVLLLSLTAVHHG